MMTLTVDQYVRLPATGRAAIDGWMNENCVHPTDCFELIEAQGSYAFHTYVWPRQISDDEVAAFWDVVLEPTRPMPGGG